MTLQINTNDNTTHIYFTKILYLFHTVFYNSFLWESGTILQTIKSHLPVFVFSLQMLRPRDKNVYISMYAPFIGVRIIQESVIHNLQRNGIQSGLKNIPVEITYK